MNTNTKSKIGLALPSQMESSGNVGNVLFNFIFIGHLG